MDTSDVGYRISDEFWSKFKTISISLLISFTLLIVGAAYANELTEQKDQFASVADELFEGLNNLQPQLNYVDIQYVNNKRIKYLENHFSNDIYDDIADDRDLQYARSLYNLNNPKEALVYLFPEDNWKHHLFEIICHYSMCNYSATGNSIIEYVDTQNIDVNSKGYYKIDNNISTENLIWIAEVLGNFECAKQLDSLVLAAHPESKNNPWYVLNQGHIYLYDKNLEMAAQTYNEAFNMALSMRYVDESGQNSLRYNLMNDLHILSRFGVIPDSDLQQIANVMSVKFTPAYISKSIVDPSESNAILGRLAGSWKYQHIDNTSINLTIDPDSGLFTYIKKDPNDIEIGKSLIECRLANINGTIYWDEFCPKINHNGYGKLLELNDNYFVLEVIENGFPEEKGSIRRYERVN